MRIARKLVLVVDDEPGVTELIREILEDRKRYRVLPASSQQHAISLVTVHRNELELALLDVALPGRNGVELAKQLLAISPRLQVLFISGQVGAEVFRFYGIDLTDEHFLAKPFDRRTLLRRVGKILKARQPLLIGAVRPPSIAATG